MKYPTWNEFLGKYPDNPQDAFEALCRLIFRTKYGIGDSLPYFFNNAGDETIPITFGNDVIGFQSKYFDGSTIDSSQAAQIIHSISTAHTHYPSQTKIIIYTNSTFGNPQTGAQSARQKDIEKAALINKISIEWMLGDNILDAVLHNPLAYNLFFDSSSNLYHLPGSVKQWNDLNLGNITSHITYQAQKIIIDRSKEAADIKEHISNGKNVLVYGESGSGKSAVVKSFCLEMEKDIEKVFYFTKGIQYDAKSINELFQMDETYSYADFRDFYDGFIWKLLIIDSAEKLTEIGNLTVLQLMLEGLSEKGWQFIFTCKDNSYDSLKMLLKDIGIKTEDLKVDILGEESLAEIGKKNGIAFPQNDKILRQLRIPFYLARYCELGRVVISTPEAFREALWRKKVLGTIEGGIQQKREQCLFQVVLEQQNKNVYYVTPEGFDYDAAFCLVKEDVLIRQPHWGYAVKHDMYVDWALEYIVDKDCASEMSCIQILQSAPKSITYQNALSRWLANHIDFPDSRIAAIVDAFVHGNTHNLWEYCILTAICSSKEYASDFYKRYSVFLKANNYALFDRLVDVLDVSCKFVSQYLEYKGDRIPIYRPVGKGWDEAILFVDANKDDYYLDHLCSVQKLLTGYAKMGDKAMAIKEAAKLSLRMHDIVAETRKRQEHFWFENAKPWCELVCTYAFGIMNELKDRFNQVITNRWVHRADPYSELVDYILKDSNNLLKSSLYLSCQDSVLALMQLFWQEQPRKTKYDDSSNWSYDREDVFGLNSDFGTEMSYFPASPFQTPVGTMLEAEQLIEPKGEQVLGFIIRFINVCISYYNERDKSGEAFDVTIKQRDGSAHNVTTSQSLWNLYRGTSSYSMPHLLTSIHMALERWLLELTDKKKQPDWMYVERILWKILNESHSASLYSVVASIAMAHPDELFDILMFLCQDIRFLALDLHRYSMEISADMNSIGFHRHPTWGEERARSNKLPHRQQHLETVLLTLQYTYDNSIGVDVANRLSVAYKVVDELKMQVANIENVDSTFRFILARVDYRSYKKENITLKNGVEAIQLTPTLAPELEEERNQVEEFNNRLGAVSLRVWADKMFKGQINDIKSNQFIDNPKEALRAIRTIEKQLSEHVGNQLLLPGDEYVPYMASAVLLMFEQEHLNEAEISECWDRVMLSLASMAPMSSNSLSELNICIAAIPSMIDVFPDRQSDFVPILQLYVKNQSMFVNQRVCDLTSEAIYKGQLWKKYPDMMNAALNQIKDELPDYDWDNMNSEMADAVLCMLTFDPKNDKRIIGRKCIEKISNIWRKDTRYEFNEWKQKLAENVAKYILFAPCEEVVLLVKPYIPMLDLGSYGDPLLTEILIGAPQYNKYENFWIVWNAIYPTVAGGVNGSFQNAFLNEYLINPLFFPRDYDDWFRLGEKDMNFFSNIVNDIGGHPAVMYALPRVFATIGKKYSKHAILLFAAIINKYHPKLEETKNHVLFYMEKIVKAALLDNEPEIRKDIQYKGMYVSVLEFLRENGSSVANGIISNL